MPDEIKVYSLLDPDDIHEAALEVERQIADTAEDLALLRRTDAALAEVQRILEELRALALISADPATTPDERHALQRQFEQLRGKIDQIGSEHAGTLPPGERGRIDRLLQNLRNMRL